MLTFFDIFLLLLLFCRDKETTRVLGSGLRAAACFNPVVVAAQEAKRRTHSSFKPYSSSSSYPTVVVKSSSHPMASKVSHKPSKIVQLVPKSKVQFSNLQTVVTSPPSAVVTNSFYSSPSSSSSSSSVSRPPSVAIIGSFSAPPPILSLPHHQSQLTGPFSNIARVTVTVDVSAATTSL